MVLTDPPYSEHTHANLGKETRTDGYRVRDALTFNALTDQEIRALAGEFVRVSRGWIIVFTDDRGVSPWGRALEDAGGRWVRTGHWVKNNAMPQMSGDRPSVGTEPIVIGHVAGPMMWNGRGRPATWIGPREYKAAHPNQKPVWLIQAMIDAFAPPGAIILDPFLGSGTTAVAVLDPARRIAEETDDGGCRTCRKKTARAQALTPVLDARVIGVEKDSTWALRSALRVSSLLSKETSK